MARRAFVLLLIAAVLQAVYYTPQLPETMASHFDAEGIPDGWSSKPVFLALYFAVLGMTVLIFAVLPAGLAHIPERWLSLPNKQYWWAPERRAATVAFIRGRMLALGAANVALAVFIHQLVIDANLMPEPRLSGAAFWALAIYAGYVAVWLALFVAWFWRGRAR
jgi:uncharacterized membrane protein